MEIKRIKRREKESLINLLSITSLLKSNYMLWHWSTDVKRFKKENPKGFRLWRLTHLLNYGIEKGEKISKKEIKKAWPKIKEEIDPYVRRAMEYLLWGKLYSLPNNLTFWNWQKKSGK